MVEWEPFVLVASPRREGLHPALCRKNLSQLRGFMSNNPGIDFTLSLYRDGEEGVQGVVGYNPEHNSRVAEVRNAVIEEYLDSEHTHVLWIDADIIRIPPDLPTKLLQRSAVVAPIVFWDKHRPHFYDVGGFVQNGKWANPMPPYWQNMGPIVSLDSVGCCYMIPADVYRKGARYSHTDGFTEHYSVCQDAKRQGLPVLCRTDVSVAHAFLDEYQVHQYDFGDGLSYSTYVIEDGSVHPHWLYFNEPETVEWVKQHVKKNWTCVDVGANVGHYTYLFATLGSEVLSYEPNEPVFDMLCDSLSEAGLIHNVWVGNMALSDKTGGVDHLFLAGMLEATSGSYETGTLDEELRYKHNKHRVDLIKIDVDGYDFKALLGAEQTITRCRPYLIIETDEDSLTRTGDSVSDVAGFLEKHEYTWTQHDHSSNWICVPK